MSLSVVVTAGFTFPAGVPVSLAGLRRAALPTVSIAGAVGSGDLAAGAVTDAKVTPDAFWYGLDTGVVNAAAVALSPAVAAYADGLVVAFKTAFANTGPATLAVNGLAAAPVVKRGSVALDAGDWQAAQIVVCRYQLDANSVPANAVYSGGTYTLPLTAGRTYTWTKGANDTSLVNGTQTLNATGTFVAQGSSVTLNGSGSSVITATVVPSSNVWQMLSELGNDNSAGLKIFNQRNFN